MDGSRLGNSLGVAPRTHVDQIDFICFGSPCRGGSSPGETSYVASKQRFTCRNHYHRQRVSCDSSKCRLRAFVKWNSHLATRCISRRRLPWRGLPGSLSSWRLLSWCGRCCRCRSILCAALRILRTVLLIGRDWRRKARDRSPAPFRVIPSVAANAQAVTIYDLVHVEHERLLFIWRE
jgi:hypothetical protein